MLIPVLTLAAALMQAPPQAPPPAAATPPAASPAAPPETKKDPLICRDEAPLGSRLPVRVCQRKSDMERANTESRRLTEDAQTRALGPVIIPK